MRRYRSWSSFAVSGFAVASLAIAAVLVRLLRRFVGGAGPAPRLRRAGLLALLPVIAVVANTSLWNRRFGMKSDLFGNNPTGKSMFQLMAAGSAALLGFVMTILSASIWPYAIGFVFTAIGLAAAIPTEARLAREQAAAERAGSSIDVVTVLIENPLFR